MPYFKALGAVCLGAASRILKSKFEKTAAAVVVGVVGVGLLFAPSAVGQTSSRSFLSPYVNSIEVHNEGSAGFSISLDVGSGWAAFGGSDFCYQDPADGFRWCNTSTSVRSPVYRWPDSVYLAYPPEGTSTESYEFKLRPLYGATFDAAGNIVSSAGLAIDLTVYIEVTDGSVSAIYCWVNYPSTYLGPFRRSDYYPPLIYYGTWYDRGFWSAD